MKKVVSILVVSLFLISSIPLYASANEVYTYTFQDGQIVEYYLDENMYPYHFENGEQIYLALPLEHLIVTDQEILNYLNSMKAVIENPNQRSLPFNNYIDLTYVNGITSTKHSFSVNFNGSAYVTSPFYKFPSNLNSIRISTTDLEKVKWTYSSKVSFTYCYYSEYLDKWLSMYYDNVNCSLPVGFGIDVILDTYQYGYFFFWNEGNLISYTANIWAVY